MSLTPQQRKILNGLVEIEAEILAGDDEWARREMARDGIPWKGAIERIVGHPPTPAESASFSRGLRKLRDGGHVVLVLWGGTSHVYGVELTLKGRKALGEIARHRDADRKKASRQPSRKVHIEITSADLVSNRKKAKAGK